jgi:hypothetical protein
VFVNQPRVLDLTGPLLEALLIDTYRVNLESTASVRPAKMAQCCFQIDRDDEGGVIAQERNTTILSAPYIGEGFELLCVLDVDDFQCIADRV